MKNFWAGFFKKAEALTGGGGLGPTGKGSLLGGYEFDGPFDMKTNISGENPKDQPTTDKTLLDRERNPKDFGLGVEGPVFQADSNPHLFY